MRAERNRRRLPPRGALSRWSRRVTGLLGTAAFLGVGVASYRMIVPDDSTPESAALAPTPTATAKSHHRGAKHHRNKPKGLTRAQKRVRASAVAELRRQGYIPHKIADYDPRATFRVLIGRPVGDAGGGSFAFFFAGGRYLGRDSISPSASVKAAGQTKHSVVLSYRTCCPVEHVHVRFKLEGGRIHALQLIPPSYLRAVRR